MKLSANQCENCYFVKPECICKSLKKAECRTRFLILQHPQESRELGNTGRLLALTFPEQVKVVVGLSFRNLDQVLGDWKKYKKWAVLTMKENGKKVEVLSHYDGFILLDSTWPQVKSTLWRNRWLMKLPFVQIQASKPSQYFAVRKTASVSALATFEAASHLLEQRNEKKEQLQIMQHNWLEFLDAAKRIKFSS